MGGDALKLVASTADLSTSLEASTVTGAVVAAAPDAPALEADAVPPLREPWAPPPSCADAMPAPTLSIAVSAAALSLCLNDELRERRLAALSIQGLRATVRDTEGGSWLGPDWDEDEARSKGTDGGWMQVEGALDALGLVLSGGGPHARVVGRPPDADVAHESLASWTVQIPRGGHPLAADTNTLVCARLGQLAVVWLHAEMMELVE